MTLWSRRWRALVAVLFLTGFIIVLSPPASAQGFNMVEDDFEGTSWVQVKAGGSSFRDGATSGPTENAFHAPRRSMEISFTGGISPSDHGTVLRYREFTNLDTDMLRVWFYAETYRHDGSAGDRLDAGVRLRLYNASGGNYASVQYWLASWEQDVNARSPPGPDSKSIYGRPPMNHWTEFVGFPNTDFPLVNWTSAVRVRVELYATARATSGDQFMMYFDGLTLGFFTSKETYVWSGTLQADQAFTDCPEVTFTVPEATALLKVTLSMPPRSSDFDLSVWDDLGNRAGGATRADRTVKVDIQNSVYSGPTSDPEVVTVAPVPGPFWGGLFRAGCMLYSGSGHYELRVEVYDGGNLGLDMETEKAFFSVDSRAYSVDAELRWGAREMDLSIYDPEGRRTGGPGGGDVLPRSDIPYSTYSGTSTRPEWVLVDPPNSFGRWALTVLAHTQGGVGFGWYEVEVRVRAEARFWSVNLQDGDLGGNKIDTARRLFDEQLVPLGVAHVRTDFSWANVEVGPTGGFSRDGIDFYRFYASAAKIRGIDVIVILNNPPQWAKDLYSSDKGTFFSRWQAYCRFIAAEVGAYVDHYQISNEENFFDNIVEDGYLPVLSSRCMEGLLAGEGVALSGHHRAFRTAINMAAQWLDWWNVMRDWVYGAPWSIDVIAIDHYPGTKDVDICRAYTDWTFLQMLLGLALQLNKEAAIMEMGASWKGGCRADSEQEQAKFAYEAASTIYDIIMPHNRGHPRNRVILASWYEVIDPPETFVCQPIPRPVYECNFGLVSDSGWIRKPAWGVLQAKIADWGRWSPALEFRYGLHENQGGGVALADMDGDERLDALFMVIDNPAGPNQFYYRIGWDFRADGTAAEWSGMFGPFGAGGHESQGGGVALGDVNGNGIIDALFLNVDNPFGANNYRYRIAWDMIASGGARGRFSSWSSLIGGPAAGTDESQGGGVSFGDVDQNGVLDAVFMTISHPWFAANDFRYIIGWNLGPDGLFASYSGVKSGGDALSFEAQGGDAVLTDWDGDGWLDLVLMALDNPYRENNYRFKVGRTLNTAGDVVGGWSQPWGFELVPGHENQGAGLAVGDIDRDGRPDLLFLGVDNPGGDNAFRHRVRLAL